jgi:hypothetical protein
MLYHYYATADPPRKDFRRVELADWLDVDSLGPLEPAARPFARAMVGSLLMDRSQDAMTRSLERLDGVTQSDLEVPERARYSMQQVAAVAHNCRVNINAIDIVLSAIEACEQQLASIRPDLARAFPAGGFSRVQVQGHLRTVRETDLPRWQETLQLSARETKRLEEALITAEAESENLEELPDVTFPAASKDALVKIRGSVAAICGAAESINVI